MAINFNANSAWNLKPISMDSIRGEVNGLLIAGEEPVMAFQTIRDQLIFTNKRIIAIDVQGITGIFFFFYGRIPGADPRLGAVPHVHQRVHCQV